MKLRKERIHGVYSIDLTPVADSRGFFARVWCAQTFAELKLASEASQLSMVYNEKCGTLRGMHFQSAPHAETKLVRCIAGEAYAVALDLRSDSPTYMEWQSFELSAANRRAIYLPKGIAFGYQTLVDGTELFYQMDAPYVAEAGGGVRYDDAMFGIDWPLEVTSISERDVAWPDYVVESADQEMTGP